MQEILNLNKNNCTDCYKCIRDCSVKAITFAHDTAEIVHNECILCGRCYVTCPQKAKQVRNDVLRVKAAIASGKRVVCSLAPSFIANFRIRSLDVIANALKALGFAEVQETAIGALGLYISDGSIENFQPMNINFSIISPLEKRIRKKAEKNLAIANRSLEVIDALVAKGI